MTYQEAIKQLRDLIENSKSFSEENDDIWANDVEALEMAIEALEKQTPKEPINKEGDSGGSCGYCPNCNYLVDNYHDYNVCQECGQAISWKGVEDNE